MEEIPCLRRIELVGRFQRALRDVPRNTELKKMCSAVLRRGQSLARLGGRDGGTALIREGGGGGILEGRSGRVGLGGRSSSHVSEREGRRVKEGTRGSKRGE